MSTISLHYFGGALRALPCGIEASYGQASNYPEVGTKYDDLDFESWIEKRDYLAVHHPDFWKARLITHFATSSQVHSAAFIPYKLNTPQVWFVQKGDDSQGFYAPFLAKEHQVLYGCIKKPDQKHIIRDAGDICRSIADLAIDPELYIDALTLLLYFLQDQESLGVCLTWQDGGNFTTGCWLKG